MTQPGKSSLPAIAVRLAAAGVGTVVAGPLGTVLGHWLGALVTAETLKLLEPYAISAGSLLANVGAEFCYDHIKAIGQPTQLEEITREASRLSLQDSHPRPAGFEDWFGNWETCLKANAPLSLDVLVLESASEIFRRRYTSAG